MHNKSTSWVRFAIAAGVLLASAGVVMGACCPPDETEAASGELIIANGLYQYQQNSVPILSDIPLLNHLFSVQDQYGLALNRYYQDLTATKPAIDENAVAVLTLALDGQNKPLQVWVNDLRVSDENIVLEATGNVLLRTADGEPACTIQADALRLLSFVTATDGEWHPRGRIGITMEDVPEPLAAQLRIEPQNAVMIVEVSDGGPAQRAGVKQYDIITHLNGVEDVTQDAIREAVAATEPRHTITLHVVREGKLQQVEVEVEPIEEPEDLLDYTVDTGTYLRAAQQMQGMNQADPQRQYEAVGRWVQLQEGNGTLQLLTQQNRMIDGTVAVEPNMRVIEAMPDGLTLQIRPRVLDGQVVIDTWTVKPSHVVDATLVWEQADSPIARLRKQIAELKSQIQQLETTLGEIEAD